MLCHMQMHGFVVDVSTVSTQRRQLFCGIIFTYSDVSDSCLKRRASTTSVQIVARVIIYIISVLAAHYSATQGYWFLKLMTFFLISVVGVCCVSCELFTCKDSVLAVALVFCNLRD